MKQLINTNDLFKIYDEVFSNIHKGNIDLFLCGGASSKKHISNRDVLCNKLKVNKRLSILYPEDMFMEMLSRKKYDLLTLEKHLADNSDIIIIVCESPGSFAELGAFANNSETLAKVVVLLQTKYKNAKSFITQGPVQYIKSNCKENVIYFNNDINDAALQVKKLLDSRFWFYRHKKVAPRLKDINLISGQYYFIIILLFFYNSIGVKEFIEAIKKVYLHRGYDEKRFEIVFSSAIRRLYKEGMLRKTSISENKIEYELTNKGYDCSKELISDALITNKTQVIDGLRLKIIRSQYY